MSTLERKVNEAVSTAEDIRWLRGYLQGLLDSEQISAAALEDVLRRIYERCLANDREDAADLVLDGLDLLTGWHGPGMGLTVREPA
jgi:hypothetical protein